MVWSPKIGIIFFILLRILIIPTILAEIALNLLGGYLLFNFAFNYKIALIE